MLYFAVITGFALLGGLSVHATLADFAWHLNILQWGVKAAYALPLALALVLVGLYWLWHGWSTGLRLHRFLRYLIWPCTLDLLAPFYILLNRTGISRGFAFCLSNLNLGEWLYRTLRVRPRTKEFLGYPILLAGLYLWRRNTLAGCGLAVLWLHC